jgi:hypothetical protein
MTTIPRDNYVKIAPLPLQSPTINYKYNEIEILQHLQEYLDKTYSGHYNSEDSTQVNDLLISNGLAENFFRSNIIKYASRFGKKDGKNKDDLMKMLHYGILLLHVSEYKKTKE